MANNKNDINEKILQFYSIVKQLYSVKKIYLYGSYAKGNYTKDSDIDIAVIIDEKDYSKRIEITSNLYNIASGIDILIEPKCIFLEEYLSHEPASIIGGIIRSGREIIKTE